MSSGRGYGCPGCGTPLYTDDRGIWRSVKTDLIHVPYERPCFDAVAFQGNKARADLYIGALTLVAVLKRNGVSFDDDATDAERIAFVKDYLVGAIATLKTRDDQVRDLREALLEAIDVLRQAAANADDPLSTAVIGATIEKARAALVEKKVELP